MTSPGANRTHNAGMSGPFRSTYLLAARELYGGSRHTPTSKEISVARKIARAGGTWVDIHAALGWPCTLSCTRGRLQKIGVRTRGNCVSHWGQETGLPQSDSGVDFSKYRPRPMERGR